MPLRVRKTLEKPIHGHDEISCNTLDNPKPPLGERRWRSAFTAIYFTRALVSLSKKVLDNHNRIVQSLSYVAIDVPNDETTTTQPLGILDQPKLSEMVKQKSVQTLTHLGGVEQIAAMLQSNVNQGISAGQVDLENRRNLFGSNRYSKPPTKNFIRFVAEAFNDPTILILLGCAVLSLGFGIGQHGWSDGWYEGGSIIVAVFLVIAVSAVSNFKQSKQFEKLSSQSSDIRVEVLRDGRNQVASIFDLVVGDIVCLKIGDQIPADGLFVYGHSLKVDESSMTGESDHVEIDRENPFFLSGTKVMDGYGHMLVTSVGMNTSWGEMMSSISRDLNEQTPLQARLNKLTTYIGNIGLTVAAFVLIVLLTRYFLGHTTDSNGKPEFVKGNKNLKNVMNSIVNIFAAAVTIVVVAIPEGLPLAVTLTLAFSMKRMMKDNAMVRKLAACETMGSATTICTDKTGTLTLNQMKVVECWFGSVNSSNIEPGLLELIKEGISLNTTGTIYRSDSSSDIEITGSPTEKALLSWAAIDMGLNIDETKRSCELVHVEAFNSNKKRSGVLIRKRGGEMDLHVHWKGAAEMILSICSNYHDENGTIMVMNDEAREQISTVINDMAAKSLRCIAFAHKRASELDDLEHTMTDESGLTLLGIMGIKDPCRPGVMEAVRSCKNAGVVIKMITGDNINTAKAIAIECGILNPDSMSEDAVVEGIQFRNYSPEERMEKVENILVMARSSPFDKLLMVQCLKQRGHVVAVTGDGTNDAPALKEADIGLSMGIQGTEVAKESSDIVILDDNFNTLVTVLLWGRCVYTNIQKFIQFQLTVNIAALVINLVAAVCSGKVPLTAVQLLWVNLIMDTLGALALATDRPTHDLLKKRPVGRSKPLITKIMWRNLIAQALYQVAILLILQFKGKTIFGVDEKINNTIIFNTFVLCQVFNEFNARKLEKKNVFEGVHKNKLFLGIIGFTIVLQVMMVEFLKRFASTQRLNWARWGACIGIAAVSWPIGYLVKFIPVSSSQHPAA
ncbi:hypothetical protein ACFE04_026970 [Oxalis oulophora]